MSVTTSQPFFFGGPGRPLFGIFHVPQGEVRRCAVLLCPPVGWEAIACQRVYLELAQRLASDGFPVLRFDHDGTGDSFGDDSDEHRVQRWLGGIATAAQRLRELAGVRALSLFGVHLGATLAACAAPAVDAASLVLWAPFLQGRQFARHVKAYRALNPQSPPLAEGDEEAAGFLFHAQTTAELATLDLLKLSAAPASQVLLLQRDVASTEKKLAEAWTLLGCRVRLSKPGGYDEMMQEPRKSVLPTAMLEEVCAWHRDAYPARAAPKSVDPAAPAHGAQQLREGAFTEEVVRFGPEGSLLGFLTRPAHPAPSRPAVVFLNTSVDPRVGPNRMYVTWARQLAASGTVSLRFDPRGVGDGERLANGLEAHAYGGSRLEDVRTALDFLAAQVAQKDFRCVLLGLCSGAYVAFHLGLEDRRVVGEVLINPQTFYWQEGDSLELKMRQSFKSSRFYRGAVTRKETWRRLIRGDIHLAGIAAALSRRAGRSLTSRLGRALPFLPLGDQRLARDLGKTLRRGTDVLLVFSAADGGLDVFENLVGKAGGPLRHFANLTLHILEGPNHTFTGVRHQRELFALLTAHLERRFPATANP